MFALQLTAIALLCLSALLFFGPQIVAYGPRAIPSLARRRDVRFLATTFASLIVLALIAPSFSTALYTGGSTIYAMAAELTSMNFGVV